ncbi:MAG: Fructose dehydrogenase cytochrome subunit [Deltaproteobacteria bacterium]|nr:Fructose dehydrogenase cytochrome subunit [Deltaproteobacteria bacterium]
MWWQPQALPVKNKLIPALCRLGFWLCLFLIIVNQAAGQSLIDTGKYIFHASGGCSCHTDTKNDGAFLAGGKPIKTPFGTFYGTNITPDPETGIGKWSDDDFIHAMTKGLSPEGNHYFPVFPYTSFQWITHEDLLALKAYLSSIPAVRQKNLPHDLILPFGRQAAMIVWKNVVWSPQPFISKPEKSESWNRGNYITQALAHCGECHTPRNLLGALKTDMHFSGSKEGPEGELAPNITPDINTGIGDWSKVDISYFLETGIKPDGDDTQGLMLEVIEHGYQHLRQEDLDSIAEYLLSLPPIINDLKAE